MNIRIFFSQRAFNGSMIVLNENGEKFKSPIIFSEEGLAKDFVPLYNIGIGTNDLSFSLENNIVIYQNCEDILTNVDIENAREDGFQRGMNHIRKTKYYRIGKFILRPFQGLKREYMLSIIICSRNNSISDLLMNNINESVGIEHELVIVGNYNNKYSIFSAYNEGVKRAKYPYLCFMHDDIFIIHKIGEKK